MGSPLDVATVPTRHLRDVFGSGVCYMGYSLPRCLKKLRSDFFAGYCTSKPSLIGRWRGISVEN
jgi:hypothetical protein